MIAAIPSTPRVSPTATAQADARFCSDLRRFLAFTACLAGSAHVLSGQLTRIGEGVASGLRAFLGF